VFAIAPPGLIAIVSALGAPEEDQDAELNEDLHHPGAVGLGQVISYGLIGAMFGMWTLGDKEGIVLGLVVALLYLAVRHTR
jgi:hypothetical protein